MAPSPGVYKNCTCPTRPKHWLGETTENNHPSCLTSIACSVSQVHAKFLASPHFIHYLISSSRKPYEVDIIHPILPEVRKIKWPTQNTPLVRGKAQTPLPDGDFNCALPLYWRGWGGGSSGRSSMEDRSPFLLLSPTLGGILRSLA